ncbi:hypothetical protein ACYQR9_15555 [Methylobacterium sp. CM6241]
MLFIRGDDAPLSYMHHASEDAVRALGVPLGRTRDDLAVTCAMVGQAIVEADGAGRRISISRSGDWWALRRFPCTPLGRSRVVGFADAMTKAGLFHQHRAKPGAHLAERECDRMQSAIWATEGLVARMRGEPIEHRTPRVPVLLRDDDGDPLPLPDTEKVRRIVRTMERRNEFLAGIGVTVDPKAAASGAWRFSDHHWHVMSASGHWAVALAIETPLAVQMFSRGRFDLHGRMYGAWSSLPKIRRAELLINGETVEEPDYHCIHLDLAYAMCGLRLDGDAYDVKVNGVSRNQIKGAVNTALNAKDRTATIRSLLQKRYEAGRDGRPAWPRRLDWAGTAAVLDRIEERHEPIRNLFSTDAGIRLMRIDSEMAGEVMDRCAKATTPVLPVHDSFLCQAGRKDVVEGIMTEVMDRTRVRLSQGSSKASVQPRLHNAPHSAEPWVSFRAEPVGAFLAEPRVVLPAEPGVPAAEPVGAFLAEPRVALPAEPGTPAAEPVGASLAEPRVVLLAEPGVPAAEPVGAFLAEPRVALPAEPGVALPAFLAMFFPVLVEAASVPVPGPRPAGLRGVGSTAPRVPLAKSPSRLPNVVSDIVMPPTLAPPPAPRPRSAFDVPKGKCWRVVEPDGRVVTGPPLFLEPRARALQAFGHDPHALPRSGKVSPGL